MADASLPDRSHLRDSLSPKFDILGPMAVSVWLDSCHLAPDFCPLSIWLTPDWWEVSLSPPLPRGYAFAIIPGGGRRRCTVSSCTSSSPQADVQRRRPRWHGVRVLVLLYILCQHHRLGWKCARPLPGVV